MKTIDDMLKEAYEDFIDNEIKKSIDKPDTDKVIAREILRRLNVLQRGTNEQRYI